jgi:hypothetical protein
MSNAVVGLLDEDSEQRVEQLWAQLDERFAVRDLRSRVPWPHVSFVVAEQIGDGLADIVRAVAERQEPIEFLAPSWSVYTGPRPLLPAIVRAVVRRPALEAAFGQISAAVEPHVTDVSPRTRPATWNPHISLAFRDLPIEQVGAVVQCLADNDGPAWEGRITRLALIVDDDGHHDLACAHPLG